MTTQEKASWPARAALVAVALLSAVLAGCGTQAPPTADDIVGTWVSQGSDGWGDPGGSIVFAADGTFVARGVPEGVLACTRESTAIDAEGSWTIYERPSGDTSHYYDPGVQTEYAPKAPVVCFSRLDFASSRGTLTLTYWNDFDIPERYIFVKQ